MTHFVRTLSLALAASVLLLFTVSGVLRAQTSALVPAPWPTTWPGTCYTGASPDAFQILYDGTASPSLCQIPDAALRVALGGGWNSTIFGQLGVEDSLHFYYGTNTRWFSQFAPAYSTVLRSSLGDLVLSATSEKSASLRFGTMPIDTTDTSVEQPHDIERMTILSNGNVGINIPPDISPHLCSPKDQIQIGGGVVPYPGNACPTPGLTLYGGNILENTTRPGGGLYPGDWRYISFNHWIDHTDTGVSRYHRFQPTSSSEINFAETNGGLLDFTCSPYDSSRGLNDFSKGTTMEISGNGGFATWFMDTTVNPYHHLFDIFLPGQLPYGVSRNTNGLTYIHTPLCITSDHGGQPLIDFTNLSGLYPDIGDGQTWMLAVNGAELVKELFVLDSSWADYVFYPGYKPMLISEVENFTEQNHHLPDLLSAKEMHGAVDIAKTDEAITHQLEDDMLYIEQLQKQNEALAADVKELKAEVEELKNQKEK